jgi:hypothetical protein
MLEKADPDGSYSRAMFKSTVWKGVLETSKNAVLDGVPLISRNPSDCLELP